MPLRIALLASEVAPFSKTGGLADVSAALAKHLTAAGHEVVTVTPLYSSIDRAAHGLSTSGGITTARLPGSPATVYFIDEPRLYDRATLYTADPDEHLRFIRLTRAAFELCRRLGFAPDILHCNDWHTAFGPLLLAAEYGADPLFAAARSVLTIHNIGYQGSFDAEYAGDIGLDDLSRLHQEDLRAGHVNALKHGILYAHAVTTVSPTYAREICTEEYGMGLQETLRARGDSLTGILNGVDYDEWDPRHDRWLPIHYDAQRLGAKAELKRTFLAREGLPFRLGVPLAGVVSRLAEQKGIELLFDSLPPLLAARRLQLVALGSGEARYEQFFARLARDFPQEVRFHAGYDEARAHWIEAASDMFLMPSRYEPCGLNQMYSLRYGTVPIVRRTGGLADSVEHFDAATGRGTGIVFNDFDSAGMAWALQQALTLHADEPAWTRLMQNGMAQDFSWTRQSARYVALYERVLGR
ncbi:MAG TPA: glycogen synthase [Steroidobacteraceae bacterium]|nr:glycogen synthase [Steroidobacteraceae bacterium]HNS27018.1 glycogen synthase [Steroidobacteraceae bacterium]